MARRALTRVVAGQLSLLVFSCIAIALHPGFVLKWDEGGISNYGVHAVTFVPYSLAFGLCAALSLWAAAVLDGASRPTARLRLILRIYALLMALTLLSTYGYTLNNTLKTLHIVVGVATVLFEVLTGFWLFRAPRRSTASTVWLIVELTGFALSTVDFATLLHILFLAQVVITTSYGALVIIASARLTVTGQHE